MLVYTYIARAYDNKQLFHHLYVPNSFHKHQAKYFIC